MIPINRRNTKNTIKLEKNKLTKSEVKIYKKRIIIENYFSWFKKNKEIESRNCKMAVNYLSFVNLCNILIIHKRLLLNI